MMATILANHFKIHPIQHQPKNTHLVNPRRNLRPPQPTCFISTNPHLRFFNLKRCPCRFFRSRAGGGDADATSQQSAVSDVEPKNNSFSSAGDAYLPVLIRMLGLDNDPLDREQAIIALWNYSLGGKQYVDNIMQFHGCVNLTINLLRSESNHACEAAAGLLRMISSVNSYRDIVAESGAIEETTALLRSSSLTPEVKEQGICVLWNLSSDEKYRLKIANTMLLPLLVKFLDDEDMRVIEAAGGVLANLTLSPSNHNVMVEAYVIPKLAKFLTNEVEGSKVIRKEAKNALLELAKDDYYKILVMEEGLVRVPLVGSAAYNSYKPALHSWPSLPDGTEFRRSSKGPSTYGASELLLGLNVEDKSDKIDEIKMDAIVGRTQQQFLARIGAIETEDEKNSGRSSNGLHHTLLPWKDGVARLVLILELEDETAITRAADAIADAAVNQRIRISFREAGAVKHLVRLLNHENDAVRLAVVNALEKLSVSNALCGTMEADGVIQPLVNMLKDYKTTESLLEKMLSILARILDPNKEMKLKFYTGPVNGSRKVTESRSDNGTSGLGGKMVEMKNMMDSTLIGRLVEILKTASSSIQAKVASIVEFVTMIEPCLDTVVSTQIESSLIAIFEQKVPKDIETDVEDQELDATYLEEAGLAISAASRLLTRLLEYPQFRHTIDSTRFTKLLRHILKSDIPLHYKDWVAACLVKLSLFSGPFENPIATEITLYETIPRLIEQIKTSFTDDAQEAAVVELNRIVSEGVVGATRVVAAQGSIFPLVKVIEQGRERAVEAGIAVLYSLSMESENHSAILAAGAVPVLRRIVFSKRPQWMRALRLLRNLPV